MQDSITQALSQRLSPEAASPDPGLVGGEVEFRAGIGFVTTTDAPAWQTEDQDWNSFLARVGFGEHHMGSLGVGYRGTGILSWRRALERAGAHPFAYVAEFGDDCADGLIVWLRSTADLLAMIVALTPVVQLQQESFRPLIANAVGKAFHAWHGHDSDDSCNECDPVGASLAESAKARAEVRRSEKKRA